MGKRQPDGGRQDVAYFCPSILIRPPLGGREGLRREGQVQFYCLQIQIYLPAFLQPGRAIKQSC